MLNFTGHQRNIKTSAGEKKGSVPQNWKLLYDNFIPKFISEKGATIYTSINYMMVKWISIVY